MPGAHRRALPPVLVPFVMLLCLGLGSGLAPGLAAREVDAAPRKPAHRAATSAPAAAPAGADTATTMQDASFAIYSGDRRLGTEKFSIYAIADTVIMTSAVTFDSVAATSPLPRTKISAFRQRAFDSYPVAFLAETHARDDSANVERVSVAFKDTVAMVSIDRSDRGRVEAVGLPPGRLYVLEPGVYMQMQVLLADFLARGQDTRKQSVLIPSLARTLDVELTRGPAADMSWQGHTVHVTQVDLTDGATTFEAWLDAQGRMWRLDAKGQSLHVERLPDPAQAHARRKNAKTAKTAKR